MKPPPAEMPSEPCALGQRVSFYPYLYEHLLLPPKHAEPERQQILSMRVEAHRRLRLRLIRYSTQQWSRQSIPNPTLLSDQQLDFAIGRLTGKVRGNQTYHDLAQQFYTYSKTSASFGQFKRDLYAYLTTEVDPHYGQISFYRRLSECFQTLSPECEQHPLSEILRVSACHHVLNFLVIETTSGRNHATFIDLISNLGPLQTVILLVKIILFCKMARLHLEHQFACLFRHYETSNLDQVGWLVDCLENFNVALGLHLQA
jgi:hypothetical protein